MSAIGHAASDTYLAHPASGRSRAAFFGALWSLLHAGLPSLGAALVFFVSAAFLAPADFGQLAIAVGIVSVALALSPSAFGEALVQRQSLTPAHADAVFWLNAALAGVYLALLVALAPSLADWFEVPELAWLVPLLALKVPFELLAAVPSAMIVRRMAFRLLALRTTIGVGIGLVVSVGLLTAGYGLLSLAVSQVAVSATTFAVAVWTSGWRPGLACRLGHVRDLARYGLFASGLRMLGLVRADHLVLGALAGPALLGLLVFAQKLFTLLSNIAGGALASVTHVVLSSMQGEPEKARRTFALMTFAAAAIGFPASAGAAIVIDDVIATFFAENWSGAALAAQLFCLLGFLSVPGIVQSAMVRSRGQADWMFYYQLLQDITTVAAIALTYRFGVEAIVTAILVKTALVWPLSVWMCLRLLDLGPWAYARNFAGPVLATLGMAGAVLAIPAPAGLAGLAVQIAAGAAVYPILLAVLSRRRITEVWHILRHKRETTV